MKRFQHTNAKTVKEALSLLGDAWEDVRIIAGGTDILGEMKKGIISPKKLINIKSIKELDFITYQNGKGLKIGALTRISDIESSDIIENRFTALWNAARVIASPQLRNMGTLGGNLCQRPRCWYYRGDFPCFRKGGAECFALNGENKRHCIFGGDGCVMVHPSDSAPALIALKAQVKITSPEGERTIPLEDFFIGPDVDIQRENILKPNEMVTEVLIPEPLQDTYSLYHKRMERTVWDFALVSVAAALSFKGSVCKEARLVLGGVAPIPWRLTEVESYLSGKQITAKVAEKAGELAIRGAQPLKQNGYKVDLTKIMVKEALVSVK
jgi:xanthine dehydrogenase YagS FAD-binding subunit